MNWFKKNKMLYRHKKHTTNINVPLIGESPLYKNTDSMQRYKPKASKQREESEMQVLTQTVNWKRKIRKDTEYKGGSLTKVFSEYFRNCKIVKQNKNKPKELANVNVFFSFYINYFFFLSQCYKKYKGGVYKCLKSIQWKTNINWSRPLNIEGNLSHLILMMILPCCNLTKWFTFFLIRSPQHTNM